MADLQTTIALVFEGVDRTGGVITGIGSSLKEMESSVGSVTGPLSSLAGSVIKTEAAIITLAATMAGFAINEAGKFDTAVRETGTLFNGTQDQVKGLGDEILAYARTSTSSIEEINASVYKAISTGTDYADSVRLIGDAEVLATGGRASLASVTDVLTSSLNAYGAGTQEAADYSDALFAAVQAGNTTLPDLAANLGKVTGIASSAGVPFSDLNAAVAALTISAGNTTISTTLLKSVLTDLISPSDELQAALGGITLKGDGLQAVMIRLKEATGGDAEAMAELFTSTRSLQGALVLANDSSGAFASALEKQTQRTGAAQAANEALTQSYESTNQNLINNIRTTVILFGDEMLDTYGEIASGLGSVFEGAGTGIEAGAFDDIFKALDNMGAEATKTLEGIAEALPEALNNLDFRGLLEAFGELGEQINGLFGDLDLTDAKDLETALQFVVDGIETLTRVSAGIVEGLQPFIVKLGVLITEINSGETSTKNIVGQVLGFASAIDFLLPALGTLGSVLTTVGGAMAVLGGAKSLGATTAGIATLTAALGKGGLIAAAGGAGYAVGTVLNDGITKVLDQPLGTWIYDLTHSSEELEQNTTKLAGTMIDLGGATEKAAESTGDYSEGQAAVSTASKDTAESLAAQSAMMEKNAVIAAKLATLNRLGAESVGQLSDEQERSTEALKLLTDEERLSLSYKDQIGVALHKLWIKEQEQINSQKALTKTTGEVTDATGQQTAAQKKNSDEASKALKIAQDYQLQLEKLASNERIKSMEFKFNLDLAALEGETEKAVAIIESIGEAVNSTGDLIGSLFGNLADGDLSRMDQIDLERQIGIEDARREQSLELQAGLVTAQTEMVNQQARLTEARADAIRSGDNTLKIEAVGLTSALELVFDEIMRAAQIRASAEGAEFLLGL